MSQLSVFGGWQGKEGTCPPPQGPEDLARGSFSLEEIEGTTAGPDAMFSLGHLVVGFGFVCLLGHLVGLAAPGWSIETTADSSDQASLGLFQYYSQVGKVLMVNDYSFCKSYVPLTFALQKCMAWRVAQTTSLFSVFLAYSGLFLFTLCCSNIIRPSRLERAYSWAWTMCGTAGICGAGAAIAWQALEFYLNKEHEQKKAGIHASAAWAFYIAVGASVSYLVIPMVAIYADNFSKGKVRSLLPSAAPPGGTRVKRSRSETSNSMMAVAPGSPEYKDAFGVR